MFLVFLYNIHIALNICLLLIHFFGCIMWKLLKVSHQTYFVYCNFESREEVKFILYDLERTWCQTLPLKEVKQKVKLLNKRFDFSEDNILEAFSSDVIQSAAIEELNLGGCLLKLNYRVKNCVLCYEWVLKLQNLLEFQQTFVQPILMALVGCQQQVEILTDNIRKKDAELRQFRIEGLELNRKTIVTKPFDFENFTKKYRDCNKIAKNFTEIAKYVSENNATDNCHTIDECLNTNNVEGIKQAENLSGHKGEDLKMTLRQKKRKANEEKMRYLEEHLKRRRKGLEYESSQSQTPAGDSLQTTEKTEIKHITEEKHSVIRQDTISKDEDVSLRRKSSRCISIKRKDDSLSSGDKIDSDFEEDLRPLIERKATRRLIKLPKNSRKNSHKEKMKANLKKNKNETVRKRVNTTNVASLSKMKLQEDSSESSSVFNFSTESKNGMNLLEKMDKDRVHLQLLKEKKSIPKKSSIISSNQDCGGMSITSPVLQYIQADSAVPLLSPLQSTNSSQSPTPVVIQEISLQLDCIKKELESLEAMRLADLKQRTCQV